MAKRPRAARGGLPLPILVLGGILLGAALLTASSAWPAADTEHPALRADAERVTVRAVTDSQALAQIARAYRMRAARETLRAIRDAADELLNAS
jgi:hypothetical protein